MCSVVGGMVEAVGGEGSGEKRKIYLQKHLEREMIVRIPGKF